MCDVYSFSHFGGGILKSDILLSDFRHLYQAQNY